MGRFWHGLCEIGSVLIASIPFRTGRVAISRKDQPMTFDPLSRRRLLRGTAALTVATAVPLRAAYAKETTIGFIYVGSRDDYGYNQAHAQGAAALKKMAGIKVVEEEKVPETDAVEKTMESMINLDGATLALPDLVRLLQPAHDQARQEISEDQVSSIAAGYGPTRIRRTPAAILVTLTRRSTSAALLPAIPPSPASSASSRRNQSRRFCATSMLSRSVPGSPIRKRRCR